MKGVVYSRYGSPEVLELRDLQRPTPKADEVLIKVRAASLNPLDWHLMRGEPLLLRLMGFGLFKPKDGRLGADIAGSVESVGEDVTEFHPGDKVFGDVFRGGFAEYVCSPESKLAPKPVGLTFEEAAAVPVAALTALQGLRDKGRVQPGQSVLIHGASGGVGTFAVQIAREFGADVTGVCSTRNLDLVRSLGADRVIDYTRDDFVRDVRRYDLILAVAGARSIFEYRRALSPRGTLVGIGGDTSMIQLLASGLLGPLLSALGNRRMVTMMAKANQKDLLLLKTFLETGKIKPVIDRRYSLDQVPEALSYIEEGHARGKVVVRIGEDSTTSG